MAKRPSRIEESIAVRLKETEEELRLLRQRLSEKTSKRRTKFSDLYGIWKGKSNFTYEEIKEAEIRLKDEL